MRNAGTRGTAFLKFNPALWRRTHPPANMGHPGSPLMPSIVSSIQSSAQGPMSQVGRPWPCLHLDFTFALVGSNADATLAFRWIRTHREEMQGVGPRRIDRVARRPSHSQSDGVTHSLQIGRVAGRHAHHS